MDCEKWFIFICYVLEIWLLDVFGDFVYGCEDCFENMLEEVMNIFKSFLVDCVKVFIGIDVIVDNFVKWVNLYVDIV